MLTGLATYGHGYVIEGWGPGVKTTSLLELSVNIAESSGHSRSFYLFVIDVITKGDL